MASRRLPGIPRGQVPRSRRRLARPQGSTRHGPQDGAILHQVLANEHLLKEASKSQPPPSPPERAFAHLVESL